jgi:hypothetical protein
MSYKEYYVHMKNIENTGGGKGQKSICQMCPSFPPSTARATDDE